MFPRSMRGKSKFYQTLMVRTEIPGKKVIPSLLRACKKHGKVIEYNEKESYIVMVTPSRSPFSFRTTLIKIDILTSETHILLKFFAVARSIFVDEGELVDDIELISKEMITKYN